MPQSSALIDLPAPPYYVTVFVAQRAPAPETDDTYAETATAMVELVQQQPGYLGHYSARGEDGLGITVSYWRSLDDIDQFRRHREHVKAQSTGRSDWYEWYQMSTARVERDGVKRPA